MVAANDLGVKGAAQVRTDMVRITLNCSGRWNALEEALIDEMNTGQRIVEIKDFTLFSTRRVSLLIRNSSIENADMYGRIKDHLAIMLEGAESRITNIMHVQHIEQQNVVLYKIIGLIRDRLLNFKEQNAMARRTLGESIEDFYSSFENRLGNVGLTQNQETQVLSDTDQLMNDIIDVCLTKIQHGELLERVLTDLTKVTELNEQIKSD